MNTFMGYPRPDGRAGVRNHVLILPSVACVNGPVDAIARAVPGVVPLYHGLGCGRSGSDSHLHARVLTNLGTNPNVAAVLVIGLGCEGIQGDRLAKAVTHGEAHSADDLGSHTPFGRVCQPEDVAGVVAFLVSADGSYVTRARVVVDGGADLVLGDP